MNESQRIHFNTKKLPEFYSTLRSRVDEYFVRTDTSKHANGAMIAKIVVILSVYLGTYLLIMLAGLPSWTIFGLALLHGFATALIGLNIGHDAIHGSLFASKSLNEAFGTLFNLIGANDYLWKVKHNIIHHTYTNIPGHDDDLNLAPIIRIDAHMPLWPIHRYQHIYMFLLYPLTSLVWVFMKDFKNMFRGKIGQYDLSATPRREYIRLFTFKVLYYILFVILPFVVLPLPWYAILFGMLITHLVEGATLSIVFQLAHVVEGAHFPEPDEKGLLADNWAVHQMYTTADFAQKNPFVNFVFGGLNFQIEHHLFPKICHTHYTAIAPIVEQTAKEFGLPYLVNPTLGGALGSHIRLMKELGRSPQLTA